MRHTTTWILLFLLTGLTQAEGLKLKFGPASSDNSKAIKQTIRKSGHFQKVVAELNKTLKLPKKVTIRFKDSDEGSSYYDPEKKEIVLEYSEFLATDELLAEEPDLRNDKKERLLVVLQVGEFFLYHELGHALIDVLDLPVAGKEEDAADGLAAYLILAVFDDPEVAFVAAEQFMLESEVYDSDETDLYDEHSLDEQRFYNLVSWIYGSDPDEFEEDVEELVPEDWWESKAESCEEEYAQLKRSWSKLLRSVAKSRG